MQGSDVVPFPVLPTTRGTRAHASPLSSQLRGQAQGCPSALIPPSRPTRHVPPAPPASVLFLTMLSTVSLGTLPVWFPVLRTCFPCWLHGSVCSASRRLLRCPVLREPSDHPSTSQQALTRPRVSRGAQQCLSCVLCSLLPLCRRSHHWDASSARAGTWASVRLAGPLSVFVTLPSMCASRFIIRPDRNPGGAQGTHIVPTFPMRKLRSRAFTVSSWAGLHETPGL